VKAQFVTKKLKPLTYASLALALSAPHAYAAPEIEFSGVVEASIAQVEDEDAQAQVDTVELAIASKFNEKVSAEIVLLSEDIGSDDETEFAVDSALINFSTQLGDISLGKFTVPFSVGETHMIEDSATLVEPVGYGISFAGSAGIVDYQVYAADPAKDDTADITGNDYADEAALAFGDLAGVNLSVALTDSVQLNGSYVSIDDKVATSALLAASFGEFGVIAEATDVEDEDKTRTNVELSYDFGLALVAAGVQQDGEGNDIKSVGLVSEVYENTTVKMQYLVVDPEAKEGDETSSIAAQLVYAF